MSTAAHYEVLLVSSRASLTVSEWTWQRFEDDGSISAAGLRHATMKACFGEIRRHQAGVGEAPITVNLRGTATRTVAPLAPAVELGMTTSRAALQRRLRQRGALRA